jgi:anti-sigma B factor antagonist
MLTDRTQIEQAGNICVVTVPTRELGGQQAQELVVELTERMRYDNAQHFIFDLAAVEFIASSCLGALVGFMKDLEHQRGRIVLVNCRANVQFLFKVTRLDSVFPIFDDMAEARAEITGR